MTGLHGYERFTDELSRHETLVGGDRAYWYSESMLRRAAGQIQRSLDSRPEFHDGGHRSVTLRLLRRELRLRRQTSGAIVYDDDNIKAVGD